MNRPAAFLIGISLVVVMASTLVGCGGGEVLPLVAPGGSSDWPADPRWRAVVPLLVGEDFRDGAWVRETSFADPVVALVGERGAVFVHADGRWAAQKTGLQANLNVVVSLGANVFVAVGDDGAACWGENGHWQVADTGTQNHLEAMLAVDGVAWAVGQEGTVRRWEAGQWSGLPSAGTDDLVGVTVLNDSLFVAAGTAGIRVWDGAAWSTLPVGPWGESAVKAVAAVDNDQLYAAADSLYVRSAVGWHTITDTRLAGVDKIGMKVTGHTLWYSFWGWWLHLDPTTVPGQVSIDAPFGILAPRDAETYLTVESGPTVAWVADGKLRQDPAGYLSIRSVITLSTGGMLVLTHNGVFQHDGINLTQILDREQIPGMPDRGFAAGCGRDADDYFLVGSEVVYHCVNGQATELGTWEEIQNVNSIAVDQDNVLYMGGDQGLWRWQDVSWQRVLPVLADQQQYFEVWPLGNGRLGAIDSNEQYYLQFADRWSAIGEQRRGTLLLAGADGTLFTIGRVDSREGFDVGNGLRIYDESSGAFRDLMNRGMGSLVDLDIYRGTSRNGEVLIWTRDPSMAFTLSGPPGMADWNVVAGPLAADIASLERMPDGSLLARQNYQGFHAFRP